MIVNGIIALILRFFHQFRVLQKQADYVMVIEDRPILCAVYRLPLSAKSNPPCSVVSLR